MCSREREECKEKLRQKMKRDALRKELVRRLRKEEQCDGRGGQLQEEQCQGICQAFETGCRRLDSL